MKTGKSFLLMVEDDLNFADWAQVELGRDCADLTLVMCHDLGSARHWLGTSDAEQLAMAVVDLPQPLSPTSERVSPRWSVRDMPLTARTEGAPVTPKEVVLA